MGEPHDTSPGDAMPGHLLTRVPHSAAIGIRVLELGDGRALVRIPYADHLIGDPDTGVVHGGVITAALDNASGMAVHSALADPTSIATLDLRIDYMRPATAGRDILASAHCYRHTRNIAFVRGAAYHDDPEDPIATTVATFVVSSNQTRKLHQGGDGQRSDEGPTRPREAR
ncbi:MAG: PaaI family thioesterase [Acidobacteria bacterium]|nr:MAG: PaaI family thioesterase [Acidobacteriota bacterium]REK11252.1 MAG: PaaI family thioesterase [Acidobacteriota bacterium]